MASASRVRVGTLVPISNDDASPSDGSVSSIPIFQGPNVVGRDHLVAVDKRISRKHLSLHTSADGSAEVVVEGPNPIVVQLKGQRRKVCAKEKYKIEHGDVLELIPWDYFMKYADMGDSSDIKTGKRHSDKDSAGAKRKQQIMEDEALARTL